MQEPRVSSRTKEERKWSDDKESNVDDKSTRDETHHRLDTREVEPRGRVAEAEEKASGGSRVTETGEMVRISCGVCWDSTV